MDIYALQKREDGNIGSFELRPTAYVPDFLKKFREFELSPEEFKKN